MSTETGIDNYFDVVVTTTLRPLALGLTAVYTIFGHHRLSHWSAPERDVTVPWLIFGASTMTLLYLSLGQRYRFKRSGALHGLVMGLVVLMINTVHYLGEYDDIHSNVVFLTLLASGLILLDAAWTAFTMLCFTGIWFFNTLIKTGSMPWNEAPAFFTAVLVGLLFLRLRRQLFVRQFSSVAAERTRNSLLAQALEQAQASRQELSRRVAERAEQTAATLQQIEDELRAKVGLEQLLQDLDEEDPLGRLAGGVAHDFNNLLMTFSAFLGEVEEHPDTTDEDREVLEGAEGATQEIQTLVQKLLAFSRKQALRKQPWEVGAFLTDFVEGLAGLISEDIKVHCLAECDAWILADEAQLQQALLNLGLNAKEAMPEGGSLFFLARVEQDVVRIEVKDSGVGMDAENLGHAREPYFTTKGFHAGRGLGLSVVDGIVGQHGGTLEFESRVGQGTTAIIRLPLLVAAELDPATVLVVEDEEITRVLAVRYLRNAGYQVLEAEDAAEATDKFLNASPRPGVLVTDVLLPDQDGATLALELLRLSPDLRIIAVSSYPSYHVEALGLPVDQYQYLSKPYPLVKLLELVQQPG